MLPYIGPCPTFRGDESSRDEAIEYASDALRGANKVRELLVPSLVSAGYPVAASNLDDLAITVYRGVEFTLVQAVELETLLSKDIAVLGRLVANNTPTGKHWKAYPGEHDKQSRYAAVQESYEELRNAVSGLAQLEVDDATEEHNEEVSENHSEEPEDRYSEE